MITRAPNNPPAGEQPAASPRSSGTAHARRVKAVERAFALLGGPAHGPSELAAASGLHVTVVYRILQSGLPTQYFVAMPGGRYRLGPGAATIGMQAMMHTPGIETSHPILALLSRNWDAMAQLWVISPYGHPRQVLADYVPGRYDLESLGLTASSLVAMASSLRIGPTGRVMAAHLSAPIVDMVLARDVPAEAGAGVFTEHEFRASLEQIRVAGYDLGIDEIAGWGTVAAPVLWGDTLYGAISVLKPTSLLTDIAAVAAQTKTAAAHLSLLVAGGRLPQAR
ncbi:IclR family transcriptional regulator [Streptomyces chartreusis]|uniref:IclR family transcriptional regulator n=1 Tax=Streptomyces chartreusis TaxID=1969 RepID=UPI00381E7BA0